MSELKFVKFQKVLKNRYFHKRFLLVVTKCCKIQIYKTCSKIIWEFRLKVVTLHSIDPSTRPLTGSATGLDFFFQYKLHETNPYCRLQRYDFS